MLTARDLWDRALAYRRTFSSREAEVVLRDLAKFCFVEETTHQVGDRDSSLIAEGRRQVFLRIKQYARLTPAQLESFTVETEE